ncbi:MAG: hypothetical protein AAB481_03465 [Patescibacteria group bacterium]
MKIKILLLGYVIASLALFLYSYTQVDLNLTLSTANIWQHIQKAFQYIGYYQRTFSTVIYLCILVLLYGLYGVALRKIRTGAVTVHGLWKIVFCICIVLVLSYPAFSYDIFNYMFTAKTVLVYHKNPYEVIPMQFASIDPWVGVMRWIHLPSAYTPLWITFSLPAYFFGFGTFLLILWNLKIVAAVFYLLAVKGIYTVLKTVEPKNALAGMAVFALNPLIIIESLVSGHNDIVMMAIAIWSMVFFIRKKQYVMSWFLLAFSIGMKLMTIFLIPSFALRWRRSIALAGMLFGFVLVILNHEVLPWYFVWIMPFVALVPGRRSITFFAGAFSLGLLLRYAPFIYYGHWDAPVPMIKWWVTALPVLASWLIVLFQSKLFLRRPRTHE